MRASDTISGSDVKHINSQINSELTDKDLRPMVPIQSPGDIYDAEHGYQGD